MEDATQSEMQRYLTLTLGAETFAFDIFSVREILDMAEITRIPQAPEYMRGVVNVRGSAVPVVDLKMKFGLGKVERTANSRIVIAEIRREGQLSVIGALADSVKEVLEIEPGQIDPPPAMGAAVRTDFIRGIAKHDGRFILILDADKVFSTEEILDLTGIVAEAPAPAAAASQAEPA